jgi:hypothetical protein
VFIAGPYLACVRDSETMLESGLQDLLLHHNKVVMVDRVTICMFRSTEKHMDTQTYTTSRAEHDCTRKLSILGSGASLNDFTAPPSHMDGTNTNLHLRML